MTEFTLYFTSFDGIEKEYKFKPMGDSLLEFDRQTLAAEVSMALLEAEVNPTPDTSEIMVKEVTETTVKAGAVKIETYEDLSRHLQHLAVLEEETRKSMPREPLCRIWVEFYTINPDTIAKLKEWLGEPYQLSGIRGVRDEYPLEYQMGKRVFLVDDCSHFFVRVAFSRKGENLVEYA